MPKGNAHCEAMIDKANEPMGTQPAQNTDREIWRERADDYYADSIHVTQGGGIGLDCGGLVIVKPIREWHALAKVDLPKPLPTPVDAPPQDVSEGELRSLFQDVIDEGCYCDMQVGFSCGIHVKVERLRFALTPAQEDLEEAQKWAEEFNLDRDDDVVESLAAEFASVRRAAQAEHQVAGADEIVEIALLRAALATVHLAGTFGGTNQEVANRLAELEYTHIQAKQYIAHAQQREQEINKLRAERVPAEELAKALRGFMACFNDEMEIKEEFQDQFSVAWEFAEKVLRPTQQKGGE